MIEGVLRIPLHVHEDDRGWFLELRRDSGMPHDFEGAPDAHVLQDECVMRP